MQKKGILILVGILFVLLATMLYFAELQAKQFRRQHTQVKPTVHQERNDVRVGGQTISSPQQRPPISILVSYVVTCPSFSLEKQMIRPVQAPVLLERHQVLRPSHASKPTSLWSLKQRGYVALKQGQLLNAIACFTQAYQLSHSPKIALQLAYLYDQVGNKPFACHYFALAAHSHDKSVSLKAEKALTNLSGSQTKALPPPYFAEVYFSPFSQSRFGLTVRPFIWRMGVEQENPFHPKEYVFFRRTDDNRSQNKGELSQIYEDNVQISGVGGQINPIPLLPVIGYVEAGAAYDLIYRDRDRWRGDLRGGLMYFQAFGAKPGYTDTMMLSNHYYSNWYADMTYFSRYNNNVIGLIRTHQGIRLLQYKSSMLNLYIVGRAMEDTRREFFNNIAEIGPGVSVIVSNRFNLQLQFEYINGVYLK